MKHILHLMMLLLSTSLLACTSTIETTKVPNPTELWTSSPSNTAVAEITTPTEIDNTTIPKETSIPPSNSHATISPTVPYTTNTPKSSQTQSPTDKNQIETTTYVLDTVFDFPNLYAVVTETITYFNNNNDALNEILLVIDANRKPGVFTLNSIAWQGGAQAGDFRLAESFMHLPLHESLQPGQSIIIVIVYELALPENGGLLGFTKRQVNFGNWYPFIPPYQEGIGWLAYTPSAVGEHLAYDCADFDVSIQTIDAPSGWQVVAPGQIEKNEDNYHFQWSQARTFVWSGSIQYVVAEKNVGEITIRQFTFAKHKHKGEYALQIIEQALTLYGELFAPYPHNELIAIEADFFDGMEFDGLFFLGEEYFMQHVGTPDSYLTALSAHETAHQWWYGLVGNDPAWEPWLDEALSTYSEFLFYESYYPDLLDWWWEYRSERFHPQGWVNSTIYDHTSFRSYVDAVYLRGAHFLDDLRFRVGDDAFFNTLKIYASSQANQQATSTDFFHALTETTSTNFDDILDAYFRSDE